MQKPFELDLAEYRTVTFYYVPPAGVGFESLKDSSYWTHVARNLKPGNKIEVLAEDGAYWALLLVRAVGPRDASVAVLQHEELGGGLEIQGGLPSGFEVKWRGPNAMWSVVRSQDNEVIKDKMGTKEQANLYLQNHVKALAA